MSDISVLKKGDLKFILESGNNGLILIVLAHGDQEGIYVTGKGQVNGKALHTLLQEMLPEYRYVREINLVADYSNIPGSSGKSTGLLLSEVSRRGVTGCKVAVEVKIENGEVVVSRK